MKKVAARKRNKNPDILYMDVKPKHFGTNIVNPMTRYGDPPYIQCLVKGCNLLYAQLGIAGHQRTKHNLTGEAARKLRKKVFK